MINELIFLTFFAMLLSLIFAKPNVKQKIELNKTAVLRRKTQVVLCNSSAAKEWENSGYTLLGFVSPESKINTED
jgi:hypothetical protein